MFSASDRAKLSRPHVAHGYFVAVDHPDDGTLRYHNGVGRVTVDGHEWLGITAPAGGQLVSIGSIRDQRFGEAAALGIVISGADAAFMSAMRQVRREIEGLPAQVWLGVFDEETQDLLLFKRVFRNGRLTAPSFTWQGVGVRAIGFTIESAEQALNFSESRRWSPAGIRERHPGAKGLDFMGKDVVEYRK